jgi:hypothetical protein
MVQLMKFVHRLGGEVQLIGIRSSQLKDGCPLRTMTLSQKSQQIRRVETGIGQGIVPFVGDGIGRHHFGVEKRSSGYQSDQMTKMSIGVFHHGR